MELGYLLKNNLLKSSAAEKAYKHFSINAIPAREMQFSSANEGHYARKSEFFFIGNNSKKIDTLIQLFEGGYAAENIKGALNILKRLTEGSKSSIDVIIIDNTISESGIKELYNYISKTSRYSEMPVVLEASGLSKDKIVHFRKVHFLDEMIFLGTNDDKLIAKIQFLKKLKAKSNEQLLQENIKTSVDTNGIKVPNGLIFKRIFDIIISSILIALASPVFILVALAIKLESKGPIFYISKRAGRGYKVFNFFKFRTMVVDADKKIDELSHLNQYSGNIANGPVFFKVSNDPRVTKMGAFLRNSSLDELPQLFNVLLGDMSLVGNRPLPLYEAATLTTDEYAMRFMAPAGMTGLWQVKKRGDKNMSVKERVNLDINYAEKYNFAYDLWIIANTPSALLQKENV